MIPWRGLPEEERWALVGVIKSFSVRFRQERPENPVVVPPPPADEGPLAPEGARLYARLRCAACHGDGDGRGPGAPLLAQDPSRRVRIRALADGQCLRGASLSDIYLTLRTGMDGTPMGSYADALTPRETWAMAAYVRSMISLSAP